MVDDGIFEFNVWIGFADLMLALVLVLALLLFVMTASISLGSVNLNQVEINQRHMVESIAQQYKVIPELLQTGEFGISTNNDGIFDIRVQNDLNSQRITFSDKLLFRPDDIVVNDRGQEVLRSVGATIKGQLPSIKEIRIEGHADTQRSGRFPTNIQLAAMRSIAVFQFFQNDIGIDPAAHLMSATTFGEFKSVQRGGGNESSLSSILSDNSTEAMRSLNRRIEITLIYRR